MITYHSFLTIHIQHDFYNACKDELAPFAILPDEKTTYLLNKHGVLIKSQPGLIQLVVDVDSLADLDFFSEEIDLVFYLVSTESVVRSITDMPGMFDVAKIHATFTDNSELDITAGDWAEINKVTQDPKYRGITDYNKNLLSILNITLSKPALNIDLNIGKKGLTVRFNAIATYWKYYLFSLGTREGVRIGTSLNQPGAFTEQAHEQIAGKTARVFISNYKMPLRKRYTEFFSVFDDKRIVIKSLPSPLPEYIEIAPGEDEVKIVSHIYVN